MIHAANAAIEALKEASTRGGIRKDMKNAKHVMIMEESNVLYIEKEGGKIALLSLGEDQDAVRRLLNRLHAQGDIHLHTQTPRRAAVM